MDIHGFSIDGVHVQSSWYPCWLMVMQGTEVEHICIDRVASAAQQVLHHVDAAGLLSALVRHHAAAHQVIMGAVPAMCGGAHQISESLNILSHNLLSLRP
jgi:hypothetical protein